MHPIAIATRNDVKRRTPACARVAIVDLVLISYQLMAAYDDKAVAGPETVSVLFGR